MASLSPDDAGILEHTRLIANDAMYAIALQHRRLRSCEPEDAVFIFRHWWDLQAMIIATRRLRRAAETLRRVPSFAKAMRLAIRQFDLAVPHLADLRNLNEHIDNYVLGKGHHNEVKRRDLHVSDWDGTTFRWLKLRPDADAPRLEFNIETSLIASENLHRAMFEQYTEPMLA